MQAIDAPFTSAHPETLFHAAQFLLNILPQLPEAPFRVSMVYVLYTLAKQVSGGGLVRVCAVGLRKRLVVLLVWRVGNEVMPVSVVLYGNVCCLCTVHDDVALLFAPTPVTPQGNALGAYKMARMAFDRLGNYRVPPSWQDAVDLTVLTIQSKPFSDKEEMLPYCYRCSSSNPLISTARNGDCCVNCGHPFVRTFSTFDPLPLVQFAPQGEQLFAIVWTDW